MAQASGGMVGHPVAPVARCSVGFAQGNLEQGVINAVREASAGLGTSSPLLAIITVCAPSDPETGGRVLGHASALVRELSPECTVIGATTHGVLAAAQAVEVAPGVSVWLASWPGTPPRPFRVHARVEGPEQVAVHGLPDLTDDDRLAFVLADPHTTPVDDILAAFDRVDGPLPLVGALVSGGVDDDDTRLLLGGSVLTEGAVGVVLDAKSPVRAMVSQGFQPIGPALAVTSARGGYLIEWGGQPALTRVRSIVAELPAEEQALAVRGLHMGFAHDPRSSGDTAADFLMRPIIGIDPVAGAITIGEELQVGQLLRLHLRDADSAHEDLVDVVDAVVSAQQPVGAFIVTCSGRGRSMFTTSGHDSSTFTDLSGTSAVGGLFAAGEVGPVGGRNHLHSFTAVFLIVDPVIDPVAVEVERRAPIDELHAPFTDDDGDAFDAELAALLGNDSDHAEDPTPPRDPE